MRSQGEGAICELGRGLRGANSAALIFPHSLHTAKKDIGVEKVTQSALIMVTQPGLKEAHGSGLRGLAGPLHVSL